MATSGGSKLSTALSELRFEEHELVMEVLRFHTVYRRQLAMSAVIWNLIMFFSMVGPWVTAVSAFLGLVHSDADTKPYTLFFALSSAAARSTLTGVKLTTVQLHNKLGWDLSNELKVLALAYAGDALRSDEFDPISYNELADRLKAARETLRTDTNSFYVNHAP